MKSIYILAAFLGLQFNTIFAAGNFSEASASLTSATFTVLSAGLAPAAPKEATFEEFNDSEDGAPLNETNISILAPVTPAEAYFEDDAANPGEIPVNSLAPLTPADADFEDHI